MAGACKEHPITKARFVAKGKGGFAKYCTLKTDNMLKCTQALAIMWGFTAFCAASGQTVSIAVL